MPTLRRDPPLPSFSLRYNRLMRRLLQLGTLLLLAATILVPISESCDRWDAPGLGNDTEFHLFAIVLFLALVLLLCRHLAASLHLWQRVVLLSRAFPLCRRQPGQTELTEVIFLVPPLASPPIAALSPLRI